MEKCLLGTRKGFPPLCLCYPNQSLQSFILGSALCCVRLSPKDGHVSVVVRDSYCADILTRKSKNTFTGTGEAARERISDKGRKTAQGKENAIGKIQHSVVDVFWAVTLTSNPWHGHCVSIIVQCCWQDNCPFARFQYAVIDFEPKIIIYKSTRDATFQVRIFPR